MTVLRGFLITVSSGAGFAAFGAGVGYLLGAFAPDYYRTVFRVPPDLPVNMAHLGFGLGLTQGLAAGLIVGLVIVVVVAWFDSRVGARRES